MTSKRQPLRGNQPAPHANVRMLPDRRPKKAAQPASETAPEPEAEADMLPVRITLRWVVDGEPVGDTVVPAQSPRPAPDQGVGLVIPIDARALLRDLEPHLGPSSASVVAPKPGLWVPGNS